MSILVFFLFHLYKDDTIYAINMHNISITLKIMRLHIRTILRLKDKINKNVHWRKEHPLREKTRNDKECLEPIS